MLSGKVGKLEITQVSIRYPNGQATARVSWQSYETKSTTVILKARFSISRSSMAIPKFEFCCHIPGSTAPDLMFAHIAITSILSMDIAVQPDLTECYQEIAARETFAVSIAHMLTYSTQLIHRFNLK